MTSKNNAVQVAAQAKPCQKKASIPDTPLLPTVRQVIATACAMLDESLSNALKMACASDHWRDENQDSINATEVALDLVQQLMVEHPANLDDFNHKWWRATSIARLARDAFPDQESPVMRLLSAAVEAFDALFRVVDFLAAKDELKGGAA